MTPVEFFAKAVEILATIGTATKLNDTETNWQFRVDPHSSIPDVKQAKAKLIQAQKELRQIKREINFSKRCLKTELKNTKGHWSTATDIRDDYVRVSAPYDAVKIQLDNFIIGLDQLKLKIEQWIVDQGNPCS